MDDTPGHPHSRVGNPPELGLGHEAAGFFLRVALGLSFLFLV